VVVGDINQPRVRRAVLFVLVLNFGYFFIEFTFAFVAESVALFADSIDFAEDSALNFLILLSLGASALVRRRVSRVLALLMLVPAAGGAWMAVSKILNPIPPEAGWMTVVGVGALAVNLSCAVIMARYRQSKSGLLLAAFFSARNDALANVGIIVAGVATVFWVSAIPDIVVGLIIMALNADSAYKIWTATTRESKQPSA
jgi:Co/Zn/Cd efflux system component